MPQTAEELFQDWKRRAEASLKDGKQAKAGGKRSAQKVGALITLVESDLGIFIEEEKGQPRSLSHEHLRALKLLRDQRPEKKAVQKKQKLAAIPSASEDLIDRAYNRVMATRSVAATELGEADELTLSLGFRQPLDKTQAPVAAELGKLKRALTQKDEHGRDLPQAAARRSRLVKAGIGDNYVTRKIDPLLVELAPYVKLTPEPFVVESLALWERACIIAAEDFLCAAERVLDDQKRVLKYRSAQPLSQAGRFTKRAVALREKAKARKAERDRVAAEKKAEKARLAAEKKAGLLGKTGTGN